MDVVTPPRREYAEIGSYAAIGDGRTVALVARDGAIDFLALPSLHAPTVFASLLDPSRGGSFELAPDGPFEVERRYVERTNVLETTFQTPSGTARVTDALCLEEGLPLPWVELARRVDGVEGDVRLRWSVAPRFDWGRAAPSIRRRRGVPVAEWDGLRLGVHVWDAGRPELDGGTISGSFTTGPGSRGLLALCCTHEQPVSIPTREEVERRMAGTEGIWRRWLEGHRYQGGWREAVVRSALVLKLLVYEPTGAIAAATTTSLPETIGGHRNYDYRYAWVRDSAFTLDAMMRLGLSAQVHRSFSFLLDAIRTTAPDLRPFYSLDGRVPGRAEELPLRGYRDSGPVRYGNAARAQLQLGCWGDLLETAELYVEHGNALDDSSAALLTGCVDRLCAIWRDDDSGIWELDSQRPWTYSKIAAWTAFDRALRLVELGQLPADHAELWRGERDKAHDLVEHRCWSDELGAYAAYAGASDDLDAAVLRTARMGWADVSPRRFERTVEAIRTRLGAGGPLLYRTSGHVGREGAFLACSFWLVEALARIGRVGEARSLMEDLVASTNDVGLLSEEIDPASGAFLGNFPQGLSHLALINAAGAIEDAERRLPA